MLTVALLCHACCWRSRRGHISRHRLLHRWEKYTEERCVCPPYVSYPLKQAFGVLNARICIHLCVRQKWQEFWSEYSLRGVPGTHTKILRHCFKTYMYFPIKAKYAVLSMLRFLINVGVQWLKL
jgi:hypothetical protein